MKSLFRSLVLLLALSAGDLAVSASAQMVNPGLPGQLATLQHCNAGVGSIATFLYDNRILFSAYPGTSGTNYRFSNQGAAMIIWEPWGNRLRFQFSNIQGYGGGLTPYGGPVASWVDGLSISGTGNVGVGTLDCSAYKLNVKGKIGCEEVNVRTYPWCDYVFEPGYPLMPLKELEMYIEGNRHLPEIPTAGTIEENGLELGNMATLQMKKIEELTLYVIELQKQVDELKVQLENRK
jgi:hypothetical protein